MAKPIPISWLARMLGSLRADAIAVRVPQGTLLSTPWPIVCTLRGNSEGQQRQHTSSQRRHGGSVPIENDCE